MSVFSILKRGRQAKDQPNGKQPKTQSDKQVGKQKEELATPRYHHVPTHAAVDALLGAPAGWMRDDAQRIRENNRKRTAMSAAQPRKMPRPGSSSMLSPLHIDMHASSGGNSSSSSDNSRRYVYSSGVGSSSSSSNLSPRWSRTPSSQSIGRRLSSQAVPKSYSTPDYSSLDAEIYRARIPMIDASNACQPPRRAPVAAEISPSPSLMSSSPPTSSPSSSTSTSPTACSTPSYDPAQNLKSKAGNDYFGEIYEEHGLSRPESFEMRNLSSGAVATNIGGHLDRLMHSQHGIPSPGLQQRRRQHNPYAHPTRVDEPLPLRLQDVPRPGISRSSTERALVPATIRSPKQSPPTSTGLNLRQSSAKPELGNTASTSIHESKTNDLNNAIVTKIVPRAAMTGATTEQAHARWPLATPIQPEAGSF